MISWILPGSSGGLAVLPSLAALDVVPVRLCVASVGLPNVATARSLDACQLLDQLMLAYCIFVMDTDGPIQICKSQQYCKKILTGLTQYTMTPELASPLESEMFTNPPVALRIASLALCK